MSGTEVQFVKLVDLCGALEASREEEASASHGDMGKGPGGHQGWGPQLLQRFEEPLVRLQAEDLAEGKVAAQDGQLVPGDEQWLEDVGTAGRKLLQQAEHGAIPAHDLWNTAAVRTGSQEGGPGLLGVLEASEGFLGTACK